MTSKGHPNLTSKGRPWEVDFESPSDVLRTSTFKTHLWDDVWSSVGCP